MGMMALLRGGSDVAHPGTTGLMSWVEEDGMVGVLVENWTGLYRVWFDQQGQVAEVQHADGTEFNAGARYDAAVKAARGYLASVGGGPAQG